LQGLSRYRHTAASPPATRRNMTSGQQTTPNDVYLCTVCIVCTGETNPSIVVRQNGVAPCGPSSSNQSLCYHHSPLDPSFQVATTMGSCNPPSSHIQCSHSTHHTAQQQDTHTHTHTHTHMGKQVTNETLLVTWLGYRYLFVVRTFFDLRESISSYLPRCGGRPRAL
jgi:hypothetical protein